MRGAEVLFSSDKMDWETPRFLFDYLNNRDREPFEIDLFASDSNHLCDKYFTEEQDSFKQNWWEHGENGFGNPPYGPLGHKAIKKAAEEGTYGFNSALLIPARTDTRSWHSYIFPYASEITFIKGRVHFSYHPFGAGFPSAVVYFDSRRDSCGTLEVNSLDLKLLPGYGEYWERVEENKRLLVEARREGAQSIIPGMDPAIHRVGAQDPGKGILE